MNETYHVFTGFGRLKTIALFFFFPFFLLFGKKKIYDKTCIEMRFPSVWEAM